MDSLEFDRRVCSWCKQELPLESFRPGRKVCRPCNTKRDVECMRRRRALPDVGANPNQDAAKLPFGRIGAAYKHSSLVMLLVLLGGCSLARAQLEGYKAILDPKSPHQVCVEAGVSDAELPMCKIYVSQSRASRRGH